MSIKVGTEADIFPEPDMLNKVAPETLFFAIIWSEKIAKIAKNVSCGPECNSWYRRGRWCSPPVVHTTAVGRAQNCPPPPATWRSPFWMRKLTLKHKTNQKNGAKKNKNLIKNWTKMKQEKKEQKIEKKLGKMEQKIEQKIK